MDSEQQHGKNLHVGDFARLSQTSNIMLLRKWHIIWYNPAEPEYIHNAYTSTKSV